MSFDPNQFLDMQVTESNSTVAIPVPENEYVAVAADAKVRQWQSKDGTATGFALDITWDIDSPELKAELGRDKITVKQGIMLDMTPDGTGLDMGKGKNVGLGRLREAIGKNTPGQSFSFSQIAGNVCKVLVKHRVNPNDTEQIFAEVKGNAKLG
jgi:hypothetical protein